MRVRAAASGRRRAPPDSLRARSTPFLGDGRAPLPRGHDSAPEDGVDGLGGSAGGGSPAKAGKAASGQIWGSWSDAGAAGEQPPIKGRSPARSQQEVDKPNWTPSRRFLIQTVIEVLAEAGLSGGGVRRDAVTTRSRPRWNMRNSISKKIVDGLAALAMSAALSLSTTSADAQFRHGGFGGGFGGFHGGMGGFGGGGGGGGRNGGGDGGYGGGWRNGGWGSGANRGLGRLAWSVLEWLRVGRLRVWRVGAGGSRLARSSARLPLILTTVMAYGYPYYGGDSSYGYDNGCWVIARSTIATVTTSGGVS